jgi:glycosyltransferase involved in cell wall biosynthesis/O-antigen/teichoic acid export membrane protein
MADLAARTASGAIWTYASYTTGRALVLVGMVVVARLLRPEDYGLFSMAALAVNLLEGSYDLGLRRGLIYFGGAINVWNLHRTGFVLALATGLTLTACLFAMGPLAAAFYGEPRVTSLMQVLSVYFGIGCLGIVPDALLQHRLAFNRRFWPTIAAPAGRYAIAIPLAALGFGAWSLAWGQLIGISLEVVLLLMLAGWHPRLGWSASGAHQLLRYSSQVSLVEWTAAIGFNLDYILVGHFLGSAVLGLYTLAFKLPDTTLGAAGWVASRVLLPALVEINDRQQSVGDGFLHALRFLAAVLAPLTAGMCLLAPQIVPLVFGEQWIGAVPVVQLLAMSAGLNGMLQVIGAAFMAAGQPRKIIMAQGAWLAVLVPVLYVAAQTSIIAVALAHVAAMFVFVAVKGALMPSTLRVRPLEIVRALRPSLQATGVMVAVVVPVLRAAAALPMWGVLALGLTLATISYTLALWFVAGRPTRLQRLQVAMLIQSYYPHIGGAETNLQSLVAPLRSIGVGVQIITRRSRDLQKTETVAGAPVVRLDAPGGQVRAALTFILSAVWLLLRQREKPDVIHAHELRSPTFGAVCAGFILRRPVVAHVLRGGLLGDIRVLRAAPFGNARLCLFAIAVNRFVAVSSETQRELREMGVPDERIALIAYGVDTRRFRPASPVERGCLRRQLDFEQHQVVVVVARLVPEKGFDRLLAAWPTVKADVPSALLVVVGDGPQREALAQQAGCLEGVRFTGQLRDPLPYLQAADCFTLPSFTEGQPISLLEAMSTGLVCVGTNIGGISDALLDGRLGALVPPGDVESLAQALIRVLRLPEAERLYLGALARQEAVEHHSVEGNAAALRRLYEQLT